MLTKTVYRCSNQISNQASRSFAAGNSFWENMEMAPADPIMGLSVAYQADKNPNKQNLGIGAYRDNNGKPYILPCVK